MPEAYKGQQIGLFAYVLLIRDIILSDKDVGMVIVEVLPISMRIIPLTGLDWRPTDFCDSLHEILRAHNIEQFVLIGHSYGTFLSAHILRDPILEPRVSSVVLIDPIPFLLFQPFLVHNFVYRVPGAWRANEWMIWYFSSRDISVAALLQRHFFWSGGVLWRDDPVLKNRNALVMLGGHDQIIPSFQLWKYLTGSPIPKSGVNRGGASREVIEWTDGNVKIILNTKLDHAQILTRPSKYSPIINHLNHLSSS
jgi:pimeloyl-ACP methyl ester carboxylesterase